MNGAQRGGDVVMNALAVPNGGGRFARPRWRERRTVFVATDGNDVNAGSFANPVATLTHAVTLVRPGDTIEVRGGVYDNDGNAYTTLILSGTDEYPITIRAHDGETPIIDGYQHSAHPREFEDGVTSLGELIQVVGDYVVISGFEVRGSAAGGMKLRGNHNNVNHINSHHHHNDALYLKGSYNIVEWFDGHDCFSVDNDGNSADTIKMTWDDTSGTRDNVLRYVRGWNNSDDGIDVWNSRGTLIEYCAMMNNGYGATGDGQGFKLGANIRETGTIIRHSVSAGNSRDGLTVNTATGVAMRSNTSYANGRYGIGSWGKEAAEDGSEGWNESHGNVAHSNNDVPYFDGGAGMPGSPDVDTLNTWNLSITDPQFISTDSADPDFLALAAGSPCRGAGPDGADLGAIPFGERFPLDLGVFVDQVGGTPP